MRTASLVLTLVVILGLGCSRDEDVPEVVAQLPSESTSGPVKRPLPAPGVAIVEYDAGLVTVLANEATRLTILERLAALVPFELLPGDVERRTMTVRIDDATVDDAFVELLAGVRYHVEYDLDPENGSRIIRQLSVGAPVPSPAAVPTSLEPMPPLPDPEDRKPNGFAAALNARTIPLSPEERADRDRRLRDYAETAEPELINQLADADSLVRLDAVEDLPMFGEGVIGEERLQLMAAILETDPDRDVRIAAADRLAEFPSPTAETALLAALHDPEPSVVVASLEALEDIDDPSVIPDIEPLTRHENEDIRTAAEDAIDWLEP